MKNIPMDNISLSFTVEDWINSDTAEITMSVNASTEGQDGLDLRTEIKEALELLVNTEWRFIDISRNTGRSGLEEWNVTAQARVEEKDLNNLHSRAKELGRKGLQYRVGNVDFTPTKEQFEVFNRSLRNKINALIKAELSVLQAELPDRKWRVSAINYNGVQALGPFEITRQYSGNAIAAAAFVDDGGNNINNNNNDVDDFGGFEVSQKIELSATVTVASVDDGFANL